MAKKSAIQKNKSRIKKAAKFYQKRKELKQIIMNKKTTPEDRFQAVIKLASLPKNGLFHKELEIDVNCQEGQEAFTEE